jgi:hypothetical protein
MGASPENEGEPQGFGEHSATQNTDQELPGHQNKPGSAERIAAEETLINALEERLADFYHEANVYFMDEARFSSIAKQITSIKGELRQARARLSELQSQAATLN